MNDKDKATAVFAGRVHRGEFLLGPITNSGKPFGGTTAMFYYTQAGNFVWVQESVTGWGLWTRYPDLDTAVAATLLSKA